MDMLLDKLWDCLLNLALIDGRQKSKLLTRTAVHLSERMSPFLMTFRRRGLINLGTPKSKA